jgi:hypothetical protein
LEYSKQLARRDNLDLGVAKTAKNHVEVAFLTGSNVLISLLDDLIYKSPVAEKVMFSLASDGKKIKHKAMFNLLVSLVDQLAFPSGSLPD